MRKAFFFAVASASLAVFAACVGDDPTAAPSGTPDAATDTATTPDDAGADSAPFDAGPPCAMEATFTSITKVPEISTAGGDFGVTLAPNQLTAYVGNPSIRVYTRATVDGTFAGGITLTGLPEGNNVWPTVGADPSEMFFSNSNGASAKLYRARLTPGGAEDVTLLTGANDPDASVNDDRPYIANERALYFIRRQDDGSYRIYRAERMTASSTFGPGVLVNGLGTFAHEADPVVTSDEREIYFSTYDLDAGDPGPIRTVRATRTDPLLPFGAPIEVPELHVVGKRDRPMWLSPNRCTLYFVTTRDGADENAYDVFVATRKP